MQEKEDREKEGKVKKEDKVEKEGIVEKEKTVEKEEKEIIWPVSVQ